MLSVFAQFVIASVSNGPTPVPDSGATAVLFSAAVLGVGLLARFIKNRKR